MNGWEELWYGVNRLHFASSTTINQRFPTSFSNQWWINGKFTPALSINRHDGEYQLLINRINWYPFTSIHYIKHHQPPMDGINYWPSPSWLMLRKPPWLRPVFAPRSTGPCSCDSSWERAGRCSWRDGVWWLRVESWLVHCFRDGKVHEPSLPW